MSARTPLQMLGEFAAVMRELRDCGLIRSSNNPVADYTELLVCRALNLSMEAASTAGYDGVSPDGVRYQVKGRRLTRENPSRQLSAIRKLETEPFDFMVGVLFNEDFTVYRACKVPLGAIPVLGSYRNHVNAYLIHLRDSVWELSDVEDLTGLLVAKQKEMEHPETE